MPKNKSTVLQIETERLNRGIKNKQAEIAVIDTSWMTTRQKKYYDVLRRCDNKNISIDELLELTGYTGADSFYKNAVLQGDKDRYMNLIYDMGFKGLCVGYEGGRVFLKLLDKENWERDIDDVIGEVIGNKEISYGKFWSNIISPQKTRLRDVLKEIGYPYYWMSYAQHKCYSYIKKNNITGYVNVADLMQPLGYSRSVVQKAFRADKRFREFVEERFGIFFEVKTSPLPDYTEVEYIANPIKRREYMNENDIWDLRVLSKTVDIYKPPSQYRMDFDEFEGKKVRSTLKGLAEALLVKLNGDTLKNRFVHIKPFFRTMYALFGDISMAELDREKVVQILSNMERNTPADYYNKIQRVKTVLRETEYYKIPGGITVDAEQLINKYDLPAKAEFDDEPRPIPANVVAQLDSYLLDNVIPKLKKGEKLEFSFVEYWEFLIILRWTGRRFSDVVRLVNHDKERECLRYDSNSEPILFIHHDLVKTKKDISVPLFAKDKDGDDIVEQAVLRQKERVKDLPPIKENKIGDVEFLFRMWDVDGRKTKKTRKDEKGVLVLVKYRKFESFLEQLCVKLNLTTLNGEPYKITAHQFRHTMASELINAGVDIYVVQKFLGHSSIAMTERYIDLMKETIRKEIVSKLGESASERMIQDYEIENNDNAYSLQWIRDKLTVMELGDGCCEHTFGTSCPQGIKCKTCHKRKIYPRHMATVEIALSNAEVLLKTFKEADIEVRIKEQAELVDFYSTALRIIKTGEVFSARSWKLGEYKQEV